jgi:4-hydroxybenzoate polyprenyltransferase
VKLRVGGASYQLKKLYAVKPVMVASGYALQWVVFTGALSPVILSLFAWQFFDVLVLTTLLDIVDVKEDAASGVKTFPVVHGFRRTLDLAWVGNLLCWIAGSAVMGLVGSVPLLLFLFPRTLERHVRLRRLRRGKRAPGVNTTLLRALGTLGVLLHWALSDHALLGLF